MDNQNLNKVKEAFTLQAETFDDYQKSFFKDDFNEKIIELLPLKGNETVLEVAAGTCAFGRSIAPYVNHIVEFDLTPAMLEKGRLTNEMLEISHVDYIIGNAEEMPFNDHEFDVVITRLSFHHFANPDLIMKEISRVLKLEGHIAIIDMVPPYEQHRDLFDYYETIRDFSHTHCLTIKEFIQLCHNHSIEVTNIIENVIPMSIERWLTLTDINNQNRAVILKAINDDIKGIKSCGMDPFVTQEGLMFKRHWIGLTGKKSK